MYFMGRYKYSLISYEDQFLKLITYYTMIKPITLYHYPTLSYQKPIITGNFITRAEHFSPRLNNKK